MTDAMNMKSLRPGYARARRERSKALRMLIKAVRENVGRKCLRSSTPSPSTIRLDRIREALAVYDATE